MERQKKKKRFFFLELIIVCLLMGVGLLSIGKTFDRFRQEFLKNQDSQLFHLAQAVDRNIDSLFDRFQTDLEYVVGRRGFLEAEEIYRETGDTEELLYRLEENLLAQDELIASMAALYDGEVFLATDGRTQYQFFEPREMENMKPCVDENGTIYMAFLYDAGDGLEYAAMMDLDKFYDYIVGDELAMYDWVIMTDAASEILLYHQQGELLIEQVDATTSATCGQEGVDILLKQQKKKAIGASSYNYMDSNTKEEYIARMVVLPTNETENKMLAIGVVSDYEEVQHILGLTSVWFFGAGGLVVTGILLLVWTILRFRRKSEKDKEELKLLREKNRAMEEITKKTRELAHHQRLETIGTLTSGIAHEFNNLLTPIMGYSILTLEQLPMEEEELYDNVLEIYNASCKARDIISRLSELSRKNSAKLSYSLLSLDELTEKVLNVAMPAKPSGIQIETNFHGAKEKILANETQMSQLLLNLILNGFHAMEEKGGILTLSTENKDDQAVVKVKDTGCGISEENKKKIFEPFFTTKETGKGTGLGLAIVEQVLSEYNGTIVVESEEGKGSTFIVSFPVYREGDGAEPEEEK